MKISSKDIVKLARSIRNLSKKELDGIIRLAPEMSDADLLETKKILKKHKQEDLKNMEDELEARRTIASKMKEFKNKKTREKRETVEAIKKEEDLASAEELISNL